MARPASAQPQISKEDIRFLEQALSGLPASKTDAAAGEADGLLKFGYHQNPYVRTFCKVLWSGYAIARGQLADGSQRFSQARRDATVSAVDRNTTEAMDGAAAALESAMAPNGSITTFLQELRDKTMPRLWSRVCETCGLPPPRFHKLYGQKPGLTAEEIEAQEEAELAALRKAPADAEAVFAAEGEDVAETEVEEAEEAELDEIEGEYEEEEAEEGAARPAPAQRAPAGAGAAGAAAATGPVTITVSRSGNVEMAAEMLLGAASEALRELRVKRGGGSLKITVQVESQQRAGGGERTGDRGGERGGEGGGGHRRRRRR